MKKLSDGMCYEAKDLVHLIPGVKRPQEFYRSLMAVGVVSKDKMGRYQIHRQYAGGDFTRMVCNGYRNWKLYFTERGKQLIQDIFQGQGRIESFRKVAS